MTDDERREIEWAENVQRLDFDDYEASKQRLADMRAERAAAAADFRTEPVRKSGKGRPKEPGSRRDIAARTGYSPTEQKRIERHVEAAGRVLAEARREMGAQLLRAGLLG